MGHQPASSTPLPASSAPVDHTAHVAAPASGAPAPPAPAPAPATDEGMAKLLRLGRELVRDSVVQRRIQEDSALREAWSDPEVRAIVNKPGP